MNIKQTFIYFRAYVHIYAIENALDVPNRLSIRYQIVKRAGESTTEQWKVPKDEGKMKFTDNFNFTNQRKRIIIYCKMLRAYAIHPTMPDIDAATQRNATARKNPLV